MTEEEAEIDALRKWNAHLRAEITVLRATVAEAMPVIEGALRYLQCLSELERIHPEKTEFAEKMKRFEALVDLLKGLLL